MALVGFFEDIVDVVGLLFRQMTVDFEGKDVVVLGLDL